MTDNANLSNGSHVDPRDPHLSGFDGEGQSWLHARGRGLTTFPSSPDLAW